MKRPTTPFSKAIQEKVKINREFLLSKGFILTDEKPLYESFKYSKDEDIICSIGLHGEFSITVLHWLNKIPENRLSTVNPNLTESDFDTICGYLNIEL